MSEYIPGLKGTARANLAPDGTSKLVQINRRKDRRVVRRDLGCLNGYPSA